MKLIIDIPDEVLESKHYCQYFGAWSTKLTETIRWVTNLENARNPVTIEARKVKRNDNRRQDTLSF